MRPSEQPGQGSLMKRRDFLTLLGGAAATSPLLLPLASSAQKAIPVIGYFHFATPDYAPTAATYLAGLKEAGFIEGQHFAVEYRWAEGQYGRLPAMAAELVNRKVDLIAAFGPPPAQA